MKFDERVHTPSALASEIGELYSADPYALLVGSFGRAALFYAMRGDATTEFAARHEEPVGRVEFKEVQPRDIDVIASLPHDHSSLGPFKVDDRAFANRQVRIVQEGADWWLVSDSQRTYEPIHPAVMEPLEGESIYGIRARTVPLQTHQALFGLVGNIRPPDLRSLELLASLDHDDTNRLPAELYEPFDRLRDLANSGWFYHSRRAYRAIVPQTIRRKASPLASRLRSRLA